ncbi:MAG: hypothetical protein WC641_08330 [Patescibacteria group bacterium]
MPTTTMVVTPCETKLSTRSLALLNSASLPTRPAKSKVASRDSNTAKSRSYFLSLKKSS